MKTYTICITLLLVCWLMHKYLDRKERKKFEELYKLAERSAQRRTHFLHAKKRRKPVKLDNI